VKETFIIADQLKKQGVGWRESPVLAVLTSGRF
jgi:hypothetical protein